MREAGERLVPPHWIKRNEVTRVPRRHVFLDTETRSEMVGLAESLTFRLGVGVAEWQAHKGEPVSSEGPVRFTSPEAIWTWVDGLTRVHRRTIVWCHNLGFDMRVAQALQWLPSLGWQLEMIQLNRGSAFASWRRDGRSLTLADSMSWFPMPLADVGPLVGLAKPKLPRDADSDEAWWARCEADVEILRRAIRRVLDWLEDADLGNWRPTGAGQGWAAFRHQHMTHRILHHGRPDVAEIERTAAWTGRCEAWRWGDLGLGPWHEVDFSTAYAQVAFDCDVPVSLHGRQSPSALKGYLRGREGFAALLHVEITTETPMAPSRGPDGILWPVGRFRSWLWDHEVREAMTAGAEVKILAGFTYHVRPALRQWAGWVFDLLAATPAELHPLLHVVVKGWSRSVVGRFGARVANWVPFGDPWLPPLTLSQLNDATEGTLRRVLTLADQSFIEGPQLDTPDSAVHVMSWIMSESRVRLWRMMLAAGTEEVVYVDTDGAYVTSQGLAAVQAAEIPGLRLKASYAHLTVHGPRSIEHDGRLKAAGIKSNAVKVGEREWAGQVWSSLGSSLAQQRADRVEITPRTWTVQGTDHRRRHLDGGRTAPIRLDLD